MQRRLPGPKKLQSSLLSVAVEQVPKFSCQVCLVQKPIDIAQLQPLISDHDAGAHGWFYGVTRRRTGDKITASLSYQAHPVMAEKELARLANEAANRFELKCIVIVHRTGEVPVGEASIVIGCSSPHRRQTFAALPWLMDEIKREVPIWKRETYTDGSQEWVHPITEVT